MKDVLYSLYTCTVNVQGIYLCILYIYNAYIFMYTVYG